MYCRSAADHFMSAGDLITCPWINRNRCWPAVRREKGKGEFGYMVAKRILNNSPKTNLSPNSQSEYTLKHKAYDKSTEFK